MFTEVFLPRSLQTCPREGHLPESYSKIWEHEDASMQQAWGHQVLLPGIASLPWDLHTPGVCPLNLSQQLQNSREWQVDADGR